MPHNPKSFADEAIRLDDLYSEPMLCQDGDEGRDANLLPKFQLDDLTLGLMAFELKHYAVAQTAFQRVTPEDSSQFALAQEWLGMTYLKSGQPEPAIEPLQRALQLEQQLGRDPLTIAECQFSLGLALARAGRLECALVEYKHALNREPGWGSVLFEIARVHSQRNRLGESLAALSAAAEQDEFFLTRAQQDFDFNTVCQSAEFERMMVAAGLSL